MTSTLHQPARRATEPKSSVGRLDVDRELSAQYLAAVAGSWTSEDCRSTPPSCTIRHTPAVQG